MKSTCTVNWLQRWCQGEGTRHEVQGTRKVQETRYKKQDKDLRVTLKGQFPNFPIVNFLRRSPMDQLD